MSDARSLEDRITQLEEISSHEEHLLQQLNEVVVRLRADYDASMARMQARIDRLESLIEDQPVEDDSNGKPPHY